MNHTNVYTQIYVRIYNIMHEFGQLQSFCHANQTLFLCGMKGFWPDGIYTAPTDAALKYDIEVSKQMGFNMLRKHIKVEPDR